MPNKNHRESRLLFVREAKKLYQKEFIRWFKLTSEINPLLRFFRTVDIEIPTLYIMGGEDYLFLPTIEKVVKSHRMSQLAVMDGTKAGQNSIVKGEGNCVLRENWTSATGGYTGTSINFII